MSNIIYLLILLTLVSSLPNPFLKHQIKIKAPQEIKLKPGVKVGGMDLYEAQAKRKSSRDFDPSSELTLEELSQLLWVGYGITRVYEFKTSASSKAKFPFTLYVFLKDGVYKYIPHKDLLVLDKEGDHRAVTGNDGFVADAAVNVCFVGDALREEFLPTFDIRKQGMEVDSGHVIMNMLLNCAANNLKCVPRANIDINKILDFLGLDKDIERWYIPLCFSAGK